MWMARSGAGWLRPPIELNRPRIRRPPALSPIFIALQIFLKRPLADGRSFESKHEPANRASVDQAHKLESHRKRIFPSQTAFCDLTGKIRCECPAHPVWAVMTLSVAPGGRESSGADWFAEGDSSENIWLTGKGRARQTQEIAMIPGRYKTLKTALAGIAAVLGHSRADVVFGWRQLMKRKVATAAAVLSLALAIGACTAAFQLVDALFLRPMPVRDPGSLYSVSSTDSTLGPGRPRRGTAIRIRCFAKCGRHSRDKLG